MTRLVLAAVALMLTACATQDGKISATAPLVGTNWVLASIGEQPVTLATGQREPTLQLASDRRANGYAGCNMFNGAYQLSGDKLSFGPLAMMRMACAAGMDIESGYAAALGGAKGYKIAGSTLALTDEGGKTLASFVAK